MRFRSRSTALIAACALVLSAHKCKEGGDGATSLASITDAKWVLESLNGLAPSVPDGRETPWLQLTDGGISGFNGCNHIMGDYKLDGATLNFPSLGGTKMYCEDAAELEKGFMSALSRTSSYRLDGDVLHLMAGASDVAVLKKQ